MRLRERGVGTSRRRVRTSLLSRFGKSQRVHKKGYIHGKDGGVFQKRVEEYDSHMLTEVVGCREGYRKMAQLLPAQTRTLLDLGCGTGLELDEIFKRFPALRVTGVDLTQAMLDKLRQKHPENSLRSFVEIISSLILAQRRLTRRYRFRRCITLPTRKSARCTKGARCH